MDHKSCIVKWSQVRGISDPPSPQTVPHLRRRTEYVCLFPPFKWLRWGRLPNVHDKEHARSHWTMNQASIMFRYTPSPGHILALVGKGRTTYGRHFASADSRPRRRFEVPESKLEKLNALLNSALDHGWISPTNLEKLAGKRTSMRVAVPPASLYTYYTYLSLIHI